MLSLKVISIELTTISAQKNMTISFQKQRMSVTFFITVTKDQTETQFKEGVFIWAHGFRYFSPWRQGGHS